MSDGKFYPTHDQVDNLAMCVAQQIDYDYPARRSPIKIYPIPRGGVPAAYAIAKHTEIQIVDNPSVAVALIDDLVDSGSTKQKYMDKFPGRKFYSLYDKMEEHDDRWVIWPWEGDSESSIEDNITRILQYVGEDPSRKGLLETPKRVAKAYREWCSGYLLNPEDVLKTFEDGADGCDEMVVVKDIPIYSLCEHHMTPIFGTATIGYIPNGKIVGLSKLSRLADIYAKRLQVQERLTNQIANALHENLKPLGVGVVVKARHLCMESRGVNKQGHVTVTSALRGVMKDRSEVRAEFMDLAR